MGTLHALRLWIDRISQITIYVFVYIILLEHYDDIIMSTMVSQITSLTIVYSTVYSGTDERKHQSSTSLAFVRGIHWWPVNSPHNGPVTWKMFPFDDLIMKLFLFTSLCFFKTLPLFHRRTDNLISMVLSVVTWFGWVPCQVIREVYDKLDSLTLIISAIQTVV